MGSTVSIIVRIRNLTNQDITATTVYDVDSFDFGATLRPDRVFAGAAIPSGSCLERTIELNSIASNCPFAVKMSFRNGATDAFKVNAKCAYDGTDPNFRHLVKSHHVFCKKSAGSRILEIVVQHTEAQMRNQRAEQLNREGDALLAAGRYHEASIKLLEAAQKANQDDTKAAIRRTRLQLDGAKGSDVDKRAEGLNDEGMQLLKENKYQRAIGKFDEGLKIAKNVYTVSLIEYNLRTVRDAKANQDAKKLNQEGLLLKKNNQNETALQKFDEALRIAIDPTLVNSIKINKADVLNIEGRTALESAWSAETSLPDRTEEAIHQFAKAKFLFEQAESLRHNPECRNDLDIVNIKVEGNKFFNAALQLESEGSSLVDKSVKSESSADCKMAREKYQEAWNNYKEAKKKFEEGLKKGDVKFELSLTATNEALHGIQNVLNELEKAELEIALKRADVVNKRGAAIGITVICASFVSPAFRKFCLPYIPATKTQIDNVLIALAGRQGRLLDVGSGDGRIVLGSTVDAFNIFTKMAKNHFEAHGVELNFWLVMYSRLNALTKGLGHKTEFHRGDLWKFHVGRYDNIVIFGVEQMMADLERKFELECKSNCHVVACRFPLPNKTPIRTVGHGVDTVWVYILNNHREPL
ncbi:protein FAM173B [Asbolus verrucosus]|uniref:Protein FAM173B n=1 Tax=Asbolus verrucosus TaxID=1661398 RepID=A0A482WDW9_ASBVE|nr:protein FAM173B [Asbolus verrucosus]